MKVAAVEGSDESGSFHRLFPEHLAGKIQYCSNDKRPSKARVAVKRARRLREKDGLKFSTNRWAGGHSSKDRVAHCRKGFCAGGSVKQGTFRLTQAILPIRVNFNVS